MRIKKTIVGILIVSFILLLAGCGQKDDRIEITIDNYSKYLSIKGGIIPYSDGKLVKNDGYFDAVVVSSSSTGASVNYDYDVKITLAILSTRYADRMKTVVFSFDTDISGNGSYTQSYKLLYDLITTWDKSVKWYDDGSTFYLTVVDVSGYVRPVR